MGLLYNVSAFMRAGQPIKVTAKRTDAYSPWPLTIKIGPGGEDTIDIHTDIKNATRLRDALTAALEPGESDAESVELNPPHAFQGKWRTCDASIEGVGDDFIRCGLRADQH